MVLSFILFSLFSAENIMQVRGSFFSNSVSSTPPLDNTTSASQPPVAEAGNNQTVEAGQNVTLDGGESTDQDGSITSYQWTQTSGTPTVSLSTPNNAVTSFVVPQDIAANTTLTFQLAVTDDRGLNGNDFLSIFVTGANASRPSLTTDSSQPNTTTDTISGPSQDQTGGTGGGFERLPKPAVANETGIDTVRPPQLEANQTGPSIEQQQQQQPQQAGQAPTQPTEGFFEQLPEPSTEQQQPQQQQQQQTATGDFFGETQPELVPPEGFFGNSPPEVSDVSNETIMDLPVLILLRTSDVDNDPLTATIETQPQNGQLSGIDQSDMSLTYTPRPDFSGQDQFTYKVNDGTADSQIANISIEVLAPPVANTGDNQTVEAGQNVTLDGGESTDQDGSITSYQWTQTSGTPTVSLSTPNNAVTSFVVPQDIAANTTLTFQLAVTDDRGLNGTDSVNVVITPQAVPPVANAGDNQTVEAGETVTLDGGESTDQDGSITSYQWTQTSGPFPALDVQNTAVAQFTAPAFVVENMSLTFQLAVTDDRGLNGTDSVNVVITPQAVPPVANAGDNQTVEAGQNVTLDGGESTDQDGSITSYQWTQTSGTPTVSLSTPNNAVTSFVVPQDIAANTTLTFQLAVTDDRGLNGTDSVNVVITPQAVPPVANAGDNQTVEAGQNVTLDGGESTDQDGSITSYQWTQTSGTPTVSLSTPNNAVTSFVVPQDIAANTTLTFQLAVTDDRGLNGTDSVNVVITPQAVPPVANAGDNQTVEAGQNVTLDGGESTDQDGSITSYQWTQTSGTPTVSLSTPNNAVTSFVVPQDIAANTTLTFQLAVTDDRGLNGTDSVNVVITPQAVPPVANAGDNQTVEAGQNVTLDGGESTDQDGSITSYQWTQTSGTPTVSLSTPNNAVTSFVVPQDIAANTTLTFQLAVTDDRGLNGTDSVNVVITPQAAVGQLADTDSDGLINGVDLAPQTFSNDFSDRAENGTTAGTIIFRPSNAQNLTIVDEPSDKGIRIIYGGGGFFSDPNSMYRIQMCEGAVIYNVTEGDNFVVTCSSVITESEGGDVEMEFRTRDGTVGTTTVQEGDEITFEIEERTLTAPANNDESFPLEVNGNPIQGGLEPGEKFQLPVPGGQQPQQGGQQPQQGGQQPQQGGQQPQQGGQQPQQGGQQPQQGGQQPQQGGQQPQQGGQQPQQGGQQQLRPPIRDIPPSAFNSTRPPMMPRTLNVTADAGENQVVKTNSEVTLNGTGTSSKGPNAVLGFQWVQLNNQTLRPLRAGPDIVNLSDPTSANPAFKTPSRNATLAFGLIVRENTIQDRDVVKLKVVGALPQRNRPPIADAGEGMTVKGGQLVTLDATNSIDPNGGNLSYAWKQTGGIDRTNVSLRHANTDSPVYLAPNDVLNSTRLTFAVNVSDAGGLSSTDSVIYVILTDNAPTKPCLDWIPQMNCTQLAVAGGVAAAAAAGAAVVFLKLRKRPMEDIYIP